MAGIKTLLNLLLKDAAKKSGQYSGIMSIGDSTRKLAMKKLETYLASAQKQGVDLDKLSEDELKYIIKLNEQPKVISADTPEGRNITEALLGKRGQVIEADFGKPFAEEVKKFRGPVQTKENMGKFGKVNVDRDYSSSIDNPSYFGNAKNMYGNPAKSGPEYFKEIKQFHLNQINRKKKEMVPPTHSNYKTLKKSLQDQEDSLTAAQIAEELGGNENMYDALRTKQIYDPNAKPLKKSDYVKDSDPEEMADGGVAGLLGERKGFRFGSRGYQGGRNTGVSRGGGRGAAMGMGGKQRGGTFSRGAPGGSGPPTSRGGGGSQPTPKPKTKPNPNVNPRGFSTTRTLQPGLFQRINQHFINNQKLKNAVARGEITTEDYNVLGGYDAKQTLNFGPVMTGITSAAYNAVQSALGPKVTGGGTQSLLAGASDVGRNIFGSTLTPDSAYAKQYDAMMKLPLADGGRAGFFMGGPSPKGLGLLRQILNYMSKTGKKQGRFKGQDLSGLDMLKFSNPKVFNKLLTDAQGKVSLREGIMATDSVKNQQQALRAKRRGLTEKSLDVAKAMKKDQDRIAKRIAEEAKTTIIPEVKERLMRDLGMSDEAAQKAAEDMAAAAQNIKLMDSPPEITDEGILQLENVLKNLETGGKKKRELNATGGRIGFDKGGMTRRTFLKILGGLASIPIIGKIIKPIKLASGVKKVPIIKTENVPGKPEWFDALVNRVIIEGDDVTKRFATGERQSIHQKILDDGSVVRVTEDVDDGAVRVDYDAPSNMGEDTVSLEYKKPLPDEGAPNPRAEFQATETEPRYVGGPEDADIEFDAVGGGSDIRMIESDVSKLKEYATGQKQTLKEFVESKKRKDRVKAINEDQLEQAEYIAGKYGDGPEPPDDIDFASGGIARMLGE